jgi:hypothetical protein
MILSCCQPAPICRGKIDAPQNQESKVQRAKSILMLLLVLAVLAPFASASSNDFLLIRRSMQTQAVRLSGITQQHVEYQSATQLVERVPVEDCIALLNEQSAIVPRSSGMLTLADGQRLPGEPASTATPTAAVNDQVIGWNHPWLGRIEVPLKLVASALLTASAAEPAPGNEDVILLTNGDRQEGLIVGWGDSISLETGRGSQSSERPNQPRSGCGLKMAPSLMLNPFQRTAMDWCNWAAPRC